MDRLASLLTTGGDARITIDERSDVNKYLASPFPRDTITYASTTANDISAEAYDYLSTHYATQIAAGEISSTEYMALLEQLRDKLRVAYNLPVDSKIVFAPSGTDLEFIALLSAIGADQSPVHNILLGADEVGSGCIFSAAGQYFADETALGVSTEKAQIVEGLPRITVSEIPVRNQQGQAHESKWITEHLIERIDEALAEGKRPLVHIVHGSKTGLILPQLNDIDYLMQLYGDNITFVVDACQARITSKALQSYLDRNILVMMTGSKFMGGPPFNGFAICPAPLADVITYMPNGFAQLFCRAEFPEHWPGRDMLADRANLGLALRIAASFFELERFQSLHIDRVRNVIDGFQSIANHVIGQIGGHRILSHAADEVSLPATYPVEMQTMVTFDLNASPGLLGDNQGGADVITFQHASDIHFVMTQYGVRLGQPVRCRSCGDQGYNGTLRIALSMPQVSSLAQLPQIERDKKLAADGAAIISAYKKALHSIEVSQEAK